MKITLVLCFSLLAVNISACRATPVEAPIPISSYEDCMKSGGVMSKDLPGHCITKSGKSLKKEDQAPQTGKLCKDQCGDGTCQQMVCLGSNCPCPETPQSCAGDCTWH